MHQKETALLGRIVAETAHDLNNVLAVTRDAGGLLQDILSKINLENLPHADKLTRIGESIDRQTQRGAEAAKALNRFAHLTDAPLAKIDIATMVLLALTLTKRHAAQRQTVISSTSLVNKQTISGPPMQTLLTISACLRACIDACPNGNVEISTKKARHGAEIRFSLQKREADVVADLSPESLHELGAHFSQTDNLAVLLLNP